MTSQPNKRTVTYGRLHALQTISVTTLPPRRNGYWVIYIHGGAWRDPNVTSASFDKAESLLRTKALPIAGFASISYRLSSHPNHPQKQATTSPNEFRSAKHPDHIRDVEAALAFLQNTYGFGARYILVGHSCGATLAFQAVMGAVANHREQASIGVDDSETGSETISSSPGPLPPRLSAQPIAIVGIGGIYDLRKLLHTHRDIPAYREFIEGAFGLEELVWDGVSPAQMMGSRGVEGGWKSGRLAVLAHSKEDELVDEGQVEAMKEALSGWEKSEALIPKQELTARDRRVRVLEIGGKHDDAWIDGREVARAIEFAFEQLREMGVAS